MSKKTPKWLTVGPDSATVKLSRPSVMNGVKQDKVTLRVPTVGDLRAASKQARMTARSRKSSCSRRWPSAAWPTLSGCPSSIIKSVVF